MFDRGFLIGFANRAFRLAPGILNLALYLLNHAFHLEAGIPCQFAGLALGASSHFVDHALDLIFVHKSTSVKSNYENSIDALENQLSASTFLSIAAGIIFI